MILGSLLAISRPFLASTAPRSATADVGQENMIIRSNSGDPVNRSRTRKRPLKGRLTWLTRLSFVLPLLTSLLGVFYHACAQSAAHLWYNDPGNGNIAVTDIEVLKTNLTSYYETMGWNQGGVAGGYTGIQTLDTGKAAYIFSLWDPPPDASGITPPITTVFVNKGGAISRFSGEGTGTHYLNTTLGWLPDRKYMTLVRSWPVFGKTYYGLWTFDYSNAVWTHHVTLAFPVPNASLQYGANSFLELYTADNPQAVRRVEFSNGWKRTIDGTWHALDQAMADNRTDGTCQASNNSFVLTMMSIPGACPANLVVPVRASRPAFPAGRLLALSATYDPMAHSVSALWTLTANTAPQFGYRIAVADFTTRKIIETRKVTGSDAVGATLLLPQLTTYPPSITVSVQIEDIFGNVSQSRIATASQLR